MLEWIIKQLDEYNLAHTEKQNRLTVEYLHPTPQDVLNPEAGQLETSLRYLNVEYPKRLQKPYKRLHFMEVRHSLFQSNLFSGAIIETRLQASLPVPNKQSHLT